MALLRGPRAQKQKRHMQILHVIQVMNVVNVVDLSIMGCTSVYIYKYMYIYVCIISPDLPKQVLSQNVELCFLWGVKVLVTKKTGSIRTHV